MSNATPDRAPLDPLAPHPSAVPAGEPTSARPAGLAGPTTGPAAPADMWAQINNRR